jgi:sec-independent protein translocase protein TatB
VFNIGPMELMVLAIVGLIVLGPERLPGLARDAARLVRSLREMATGARQQLRDELGPEFADVDLSSLNPRTAVQRALLGDDVDLRRFQPAQALQDMLMGDGDQTVQADQAVPAVPGDQAVPAVPADQAVQAEQPSTPNTPQPAPRPRPNPVSMRKPGEPGGPSPYDVDAT